MKGIRVKAITREISKVKGFLKMKRGLLTLVVAVSVSVFAVAQLTKANDGCPEGQVQTSQGCVDKSGSASIPSGGSQATTTNDQPAPTEPSPAPSEPEPSQPTPGCTQ